MSSKETEPNKQALSPLDIYLARRTQDSLSKVNNPEEPENKLSLVVRESQGAVDVDFTKMVTIDEEHEEKSSGVRIRAKVKQRKLAKHNIKAHKIRSFYEKQLSNERKEREAVVRDISVILEKLQQEFVKLSEPLHQTGSMEEVKKFAVSLRRASLTPDINYLLLEASSKGDLVELKACLQFPGVDIHEKDEDGNTALMNLVLKIVDKETYSKDAHDQQSTLIREVFTMMAKLGFSLNEAYSDLKTPLYLLVCEEATDLLQVYLKNLLVENISSVPNPYSIIREESKNKHSSCWHIAIEKQNYELVHLCTEFCSLKQNYITDFSLENGMEFGLLGGTTDEIAWKSIGSPTHLVLELSDTEDECVQLLKILLAEKQFNEDENFCITLFNPNEVNSLGQTILHLAAKKGYEQVVQQILVYKYVCPSRAPVFADLNLQDKVCRMTAIMYAIAFGHSNVAETLFHNWEHRRSRNDLYLRSNLNNQNCLHLACSSTVELDDIVLLLCRNKIDTNLVDSYGFSALQLACLNGHVLIVETLLKYNSNFACCSNDYKETPLHIVAALGSLNIVNLLLSAGAEVQGENIFGRTALHHAFEKLSLLQNIEKQREKWIFKPNMKQNFGFLTHPTSPSLEATLQSYQQDSSLIEVERAKQNLIIKRLLEAGANLDHEDNLGEAAFITSAREQYFESHKLEMMEIVQHPNELGYTHELFIDKRTQASVRTMYLKSGSKLIALRNLAYWIFYISLLTYVSLGYNGVGYYDAFGFEEGLKERFVFEEWDSGGKKNIHDISNLEDWNLYLVNSLFPAIHDLTFGNVFKFPHFYTTDTGERNEVASPFIVLVGATRLRQQRAKARKCSGSTSLSEILDYMICTASADALHGFLKAFRDLEDKTPITCLESGQNIEHSRVSAIHTWGTYGYYGEDGYVVNLPRSLIDLTALQRALNSPNCSFISMNTRVIMVELNIYSPETELFSYVRIFLEQSASGMIKAGFRFDTFKIFPYHSRADFTRLFFEAFFLLLSLLNLSNEVHSMVFEKWEKKYIEENYVPRYWFPILKSEKLAIHFNTEDVNNFKILFTIPCLSLCLCIYRSEHIVSPYFVNPFNYMDLCIAAMVCILFFIQLRSYILQENFFAQVGYIHAYSEEFIDFTDLLVTASMRQYFLALLIFFCYIKILEYIQVSSMFAIPVIVIGGMIRELLSFFTIFFLFIVAFGLFQHIVFGLKFSPARTLFVSSVDTFRSSLGEIDFDGLSDVDQSLGYIFGIMLAFSLVILLLNLLIAVMNEAYEEVKNTAEARWCYIQFRTILRNRKLTLGTKTQDKLGRKSTSKPTKDSPSWLNWLFQRGNQNEDKFLTLGKFSLARDLANLDKNTLGNDTYFIPDKKSRSNFRLKSTSSKVSPV
eukprot:snap_masked-scaffold_11-processed-gene-2.3-mRNA-1 protein AED:0.87 eAED:0.87 QI:0/-1/0/1/-1/1/1/0/1388